jgi:hypothetical protein
MSSLRTARQRIGPHARLLIPPWPASEGARTRAPHRIGAGSKEVPPCAALHCTRTDDAQQKATDRRAGVTGGRVVQIALDTIPRTAQHPRVRRAGSAWVCARDPARCKCGRVEQAGWMGGGCGWCDGDTGNRQAGGTHLSALHVFGCGAKRDARACTGVRIWKGHRQCAWI